MLPTHIAGVMLIGDMIHPSLPESAEIFLERMTLFSEGCLVLIPSSAHDSSHTASNVPPGGESGEQGEKERETEEEEEEKQKIYGYAISHPIPFNQPPELDTLLGSVPLLPGTVCTTTENVDGDSDPSKGAHGQYYIHDIAILPEARGLGQAGSCISHLLGVAKKYGFKSSCLVSVYGTRKFWGRYGFLEAFCTDEKLREKVKGYGEGAVFLVREET